MKLTFFIPISSIWLLTSSFSLAILDTNNNGLSDFWEKNFNNGNLFDETFDPQADPDCDGWNNAQEAAASTSPFDANPPVGMIRPATFHFPEVWSEPDEFNQTYLISPATIRVSWPTLAGKQYVLSYSPVLTQGSWLPVGSPFIANGGTANYYFNPSQSEKCFWRVSASDADSDSDGLSNHEEIQAGTDPYLTDSDGDALSDWQEFMTGTDSLNQDTDGDGIPDSIDPQPLVSAVSFPDSDGDGIPDGDDAAPDDPRGPAPSVASENASGNPVCDLIKDETVKFVITVSNPAGSSAPVESDLAFFLNGTETPADISDITGAPLASPSYGGVQSSTRRFLLAWPAKTTSNYPTRTLQNLTLRFRDAQQATSWLKLARVDVAEWEGMVAASPKGESAGDWYVLYTRSHRMGVLQKSAHWLMSRENDSRWYRGPKQMGLYYESGSHTGATAVIGDNIRQPLFFISNPSSGVFEAGNAIDISDPQTYSHHMEWYSNTGDSTFRVKYDSGTDISVPPGASISNSIVEAPQNGLPSHHVEISRNGDPHTATRWSLYHADSPFRIFLTLNFFDEYFELLMGFLDIAAKITPHAAGTLEFPGMPLQSAYNTGWSQQPVTPLPIGQDAWHKSVLKVGPDAAALSNGIGLWLRKGQNGDAGPQAGFAMKVQAADGTLLDLTVPADGKITLAAGTPHHQQLLSSAGLTVFIKRDATITDTHDFSVQLLKKQEWYPRESTRIASIDILPCEIVPDWNRDGKIDLADRGKVTAEKPWRWWINDNNDQILDERSGSGNDIPKQSASARDCNDMAVDGMRDHIDFFPVHLDLKSVLLLFPESDYKYLLRHEEEALKFYEYPTCIVDGMEEAFAPNRHVKVVGVGRGLATKELKLASMQGSELSTNLLGNAKDGKGVVVIEGAKKTAKPLILKIVKKSDNSSLSEIQFPIRIVDVEDMYRHVNMRDVLGGSGGHETQTSEPSGYPDDLTNGKYVAFVHGYYVSGDNARGSQSNIFKRLHQLGSKARFIGVTWFGDPAHPGINLGLPPDYHRAVDHGLRTGMVFGSRLGFTEDSSLTILAHSLGNSVAGNAIANHGLEVDYYYIINGAIPLQAYDSAQTSNSSGDADMKRNMTEDDWKPFYDYGFGEQQRHFAANWHNLFAGDPDDNRNLLTWNDLFAKPELLAVAYNFYSPSDEVVENPDTSEEFGDWGNLWAAATEGRHAWVQQEIAKGGQNLAAGAAFHDLNGGWQFNGAWDIFESTGNSGYNRRRTPLESSAIPDENLKTEPFHRRFLYESLYDPAQGSATAADPNTRYKLLGTGIPATSYAIAVNSVPKFDLVNGGDQRNFNMPQALRSSGGYSSWPAHENSNNPEDWMHSDFMDVALQFLHPMYQKMIDLADLDEN